MTNDQLIFTSGNADETKARAAVLAPLVQAGDVILLDGDLGAGKTQFSQGFAAALDVTSPVTSPTFTILLEYREGRLPLYHFDLYRLDDAEELEDIAFYDVIESDGASLIEWADKFPDAMPEDRLGVHISIAPDGTRTFEVTAQGARSEALLEEWRGALQA